MNQKHDEDIDKCTHGFQDDVGRNVNYHVSLNVDVQYSIYSNDGPDCNRHFGNPAPSKLLLELKKAHLKDYYRSLKSWGTGLREYVISSSGHSQLKFLARPPPWQS